MERDRASMLAGCAVIYSNASMLDKCIRALGERPATRAAMIMLVLIAPLVNAQSSVRSTTPLLASPGGRQLATVRAGAALRTAAARQGHTQVTLDGYISASLLGSGRDSFPNVVKAPSGARLRGAGRADAPVVADLLDGMGVTIISRTGDWVRVRRTGWITSTALGAAARAPAGDATPAAQRGGPTGGAPAPRPIAAPPVAGTPAGQDSARAPVHAVSPSPPAGALTPTASAEMRAAPSGRQIARVDSGAHLTPLARDNGWTRVRIEGWVRDQDVVPADTSLRLSLSAADIRAAPDDARGAMVRWEIQFIAIQKADELRRDLRAGEPYILARGPGAETGLLYFAIPPGLVAAVERFEPLQTLTVTARVRVGRSEPVGIPILDLLSVAAR